MHTLRSLSPALVAKIFSRLSLRPNSTGGRPSAPLGARILTSPEDIFKHNMWDHVQWTEEEKENARQKAEENSCVRIPLKEQGKYDTEACRYWDTFYEMHQDKFFKDRKWLFLEFPELLPLGPESIATDGRLGGQQASYPQSSGPGRDTETRHHQQNDPSHQHRNADISGCQHSCHGEELDDNEAAIQATSFPGQHASFRILELVKDHPDYDPSVCHAFACDICEEMASFPFPPQSLDVILAVFVLSSIHPERMQGVVNRLSRYLKHGGIFLFRDYGRYDFSQLRFKKGRCLSENFYTRGDGTCVYFFTKEEVHNLFSNAGLEEIQNLEDRRLQVNRGKKVAMHRVWMQSKYRKLYPTS